MSLCKCGAEAVQVITAVQPLVDEVRYACGTVRVQPDPKAGLPEVWRRTDFCRGAEFQGLIDQMAALRIEVEKIKKAEGWFG
jgi:hypothetical protein